MIRSLTLLPLKLLQFLRQKLYRSLVNVRKNLTICATPLLPLACPRLSPRTIHSYIYALKIVCSPLGLRIHRLAPPYSDALDSKRAFLCSEISEVNLTVEDLNTLVTSPKYVSNCSCFSLLSALAPEFSFKNWKFPVLYFYIVIL